MARKWNGEPIERAHAIYSERQRTVVLTFPTVEAAQRFDELDDDEVLELLAAAQPVLTETAETLVAYRAGLSVAELRELLEVQR